MEGWLAKVDTKRVLELAGISLSDAEIEDAAQVLEDQMGFETLTYMPEEDREVLFAVFLRNWALLRNRKAPGFYV